MNIDIQIIRDSFELTKPIGDQIINRFYENLFLEHPELKEFLSRGDIQKQKEILLNTLVTTIDNLDKPESLSSFLIHLGEKHLNYNMIEMYNDFIGRNFIKTLSQFLGRYWSDELNRQWNEVYKFISLNLKKGAQNKMKNQKQDTSLSEIKIQIPEYLPDHKIEFPYLTNEIKNSLQQAVKTMVMKQIKSEVKKYIDEEIQAINLMNPEEILEKAFQE
ncbi:globin domain-containing protein [Silvanigrella aquatica]|uniref:Globin domain-containing protein n=1 Tax=Silvanigrella aquatica TaxID=1915309 RepID=A0A1L4CYV2_9BACT|nr:globin domain-containing protein [Silvanigrella aquatica]APJ03131.1 hypothetical protein AXG55_04100 [Silvanigrella aquatica]